MSVISDARETFHQSLLEGTLTLGAKGVPSNADKDNRLSVQLAKSIFEDIGGRPGNTPRPAGQTSGTNFEGLCATFLRETFLRVGHLRPGKFKVKQVSGRNRLAIAEFEQYEHLADLDKLATHNKVLAAALGSDYTITPDLIVTRSPEDDAFINKSEKLVDEKTATYASLRRSANELALLHASISCKWTIRSDRAQNSRTEALNLIKNRKGRLPHVVVVTAEPLPSRLAAIALGTGEIDCVYHFALHELRVAVDALEHDETAKDMLDIMVHGKRIRDIGDLPLDLAV